MFNLEQRQFLKINHNVYNQFLGKDNLHISIKLFRNIKNKF